MFVFCICVVSWSFQASQCNLFVCLYIGYQCVYRNIQSQHHESNTDVLTPRSVIQLWPNISKHNGPHLNAIEISLEAMHDVDLLHLIVIQT